MGIIEKLETFLNALLFKLGELIVKLCPASIKKAFAYIRYGFAWVLSLLKSLPSLAWAKIQILLKYLQTIPALLTSCVKDVQATSKKVWEHSKEKSPGKLKKIIMTPFLMIAHWLEGLTTAQSMLLLSFSFGSVFAVMGIFYSGQKLLHTQNSSTRNPASAEVIEYERPDYYKKQGRHFTLVSVRLPIYYPQVNELRSVDIDFTATLSNRFSKKFLEKNEFNLRDHLVLNIEPSVATFPLEEEGKEILRQKLFAELNVFLQNHNVEGEVEDLKITYVLAN